MDGYYGYGAYGGYGAPNGYYRQRRFGRRRRSMKVGDYRMRPRRDDGCCGDSCCCTII